MSMNRRRWVTFCAALLLAALPAGSAAGQSRASAVVDVRTTSTQDLHGGAELVRIEATLSGGATARGTAVLWTGGDDLRLVAEPADPDRLTLAPLASITRRTPGYGTVAAVNGGYHLSGVPGVSNGPSLFAGAIQSSTTLHGDMTELVGGRGSVASIDGRLVYDRAGFEVFLQTEDGTLVTPVDVNRPSGPYGASLYTAEGRAGRRLPGGRSFHIDIETLVPGMSLWTRLEAPAADPAGELLLILGEGLSDAPVEPGDRILITTELRSAAGRFNGTTPDWIVPGGPLLLRSGTIMPAVVERGLDRDMSEALSENHRFGRHPRTAVASGGGRNMLIVIDGRQPGWSSGVTLHELADILRSFGMTDATNLDGGGPSEMMARIEGPIRTVSRPSEARRGSVSALLLVSPQPAGPSGIPWGSPASQNLTCDFSGEYEPVAVEEGVWHSPAGTFELPPDTSDAVALCGPVGQTPGRGDLAVWWSEGQATFADPKRPESAGSVLLPRSSTPPEISGADGTFEFRSPLGRVNIADDGQATITLAPLRRD